MFLDQRVLALGKPWETVSDLVGSVPPAGFWRQLYDWERDLQECLRKRNLIEVCEVDYSAEGKEWERPVRTGLKNFHKRWWQCAQEQKSQMQEVRRDGVTGYHSQGDRDEGRERRTARNIIFHSIVFYPILYNIYLITFIILNFWRLGDFARELKGRLEWKGNRTHLGWGLKSSETSRWRS